MRETKRTEQQARQCGVRLHNGEVKGGYANLHAAADAAQRINGMAEQVGAPTTAVAVQRTVTIVTTTVTTGTDWTHPRGGMIR